ncbi:hypothetical protein [Elizabethkingia anophelis]|uniref:hypothetical protein n=1 Tax=Elizabethkingia anophelis TaxID=1117645 RepID=UPI0021A7C126|nr:hypothetical protein [Elizabethkingia anophelis]CAH1137160.1 hypothetical protein EAVVTKC53_03622 [Elizabethkingia anophelis]CAI9687448.1 hypothetical protein EAVVTKC53_03713 [Elizabethkingia anophelis]
MEFNKLIPVTTFIKLLEKKAYSEYKVLKESYKSFVELPLTLEMIVPSNNRGVLIKEPVFPSPEYGINLYAYETFLDDKDIFQKAKENLFLSLMIMKLQMILFSLMINKLEFQLNLIFFI